MAIDKIKNSLRFTIERADNGYIITQLKLVSKSNQYENVKEVVLDSNVSQRIGQLLQLENVRKGVPLVYMIDVVKEDTLKKRNETETDQFMLLKMLYAKYNKHYPHNLVGLMIDDRIEMLGDDAVIASKFLDKPLVKVGGVDCLFFEAGLDGNKEYAKLPNKEVIETSNEMIEEWGRTHSIEEIVPPSSDVNKNDKQPKK